MKEEKSELDSTQMQNENYMASLKTKNVNRLKSITIDSGDFFECLKTLLIISLPHLTIVIIFFAYSIIGASFIQEIETLDLFNKASTPKPQLTVPHQYINEFEANLKSRLNAEALDKQPTDLQVVISKFLNNKKIDESDARYKKIYSHLENYKDALQTDFKQSILRLVQEEKRKLQIKLNKDIADTKSKEASSNLSWRFPNSLYYTISLLTTIGYGDIAPQTALGKLFTIVYAMIGIPLTFILLSDLGSVFTHFLKFAYALTLNLEREGYFNKLKGKIPILFILRDLSPDSKKRRHSKTLIEPLKQISPKPFIDIAVNSYDETDDKFDFPLSVLLSIVFSYLSIGAIFSSLICKWSLLDGYYFCVVSLTKIGFGDVVMSEPKLWLFSIAYTLFGVAFIALTLKYLEVKFKYLLIRTSQNVVGKIINFLNQLGYKLDIDDSFAETSTHDASVMIDADDVFYHSRANMSRRKSSFLHKRSSLLKDLNEFKILNSIGNFEVTKCDKQTQITTLLCTRNVYEPNVSQMVSTKIVQPVFRATTLDTLEEDSLKRDADNNNNKQDERNFFFSTDLAKEEAKIDDENQTKKVSSPIPKTTRNRFDSSSATTPETTPTMPRVPINKFSIRK